MFAPCLAGHDKVAGTNYFSDQAAKPSGIHNCSAGSRISVAMEKFKRQVESDCLKIRFLDRALNTKSSAAFSVYMSA